MVRPELFHVTSDSRIVAVAADTSPHSTTPTSSSRIYARSDERCGDGDVPSGEGERVAEMSRPITGGAHGWPFSASVRDLSEVGYTEKEYVFSGEAQQIGRAHV